MTATTLILLFFFGVNDNFTIFANKHNTDTETHSLYLI